MTCLKTKHDFAPIFANYNSLNQDMATIKSLILFLLAGVCEIGGGYLIWLWLKVDKPFWYGILGGIILALYGIVATWQTANFGRVYATYGGIFIVLSLLWAWKIDGFRPDRYDIIGALIALMGVCIIYYTPRIKN
jgi:small multidrug resistance family-3 protein